VLRAEDVTGGSSRVVWWQCPADPSHCWRATVANRVGRASGCPMCSRAQPARNRASSES
jgi:hypothetical protein